MKPNAANHFNRKPKAIRHHCMNRWTPLKPLGGIGFCALEPDVADAVFSAFRITPGAIVADQPSVQVINLMLKDTRKQAGCLELDPVATSVLAGGLEASVSRNLHKDAGNTEAAFRQAVAALPFNDVRID